MQKSETSAYHALLMALRGNFKMMEKLKEASADWASAWNAWLDTHASNIDAEREDQALHDAGIAIVLLDDPRYPKILRETPRPPFALYARGNLSLLERDAVAIVGTRKASREGTALARNWAEEIARAGIVIVSGLALGIDAAAHEGALAARGDTVAVLGNGAGTIYPKTNERLGKKIIADGGLIVSEYPPGTPSMPSYFLERNRIIAGLSRGTVIIEAPARSGTLATARCAIEAGREVFVVPGPVTHPNFKGSHGLIREGAELVRGTEDILESLGLKQEAREAAETEMDPGERALLEIFGRSTRAVRAETLIEESGLPAGEVNKALTFLIMKSMIVETGDGYALIK